MIKMMKNFFSSIGSISKKFISFVPFNIKKYNFDLNGSNKELVDIVNKKIFRILPILSNDKTQSINYNEYVKFFDFLNYIGLIKNFSIISKFDNLNIEGSFISPILNNSNNNKLVIFCHGVTEDRWSSFYTVHLCLQRGYKVIVYDARNHGSSGKSFTTLGQIESFDLNDIIDWANENLKDIKKISIYGFSMGASTCIFWLKRFWMKSKKKKIFSLICDSIFDSFEARRKEILGIGINKHFKNFLLKYALKKRLDVDYDLLKNVNPILNLPPEIPIKILLLHGFADSFVNWESSLNIFNKLKKLKGGEKVSFYICKFSNHCELPIISDRVPNSLFLENINNLSPFSFFRDLFFDFLELEL